MPLKINTIEDTVDLSFSIQDLIDITSDEEAQIEQGNALGDMEQVFITKLDEKVRPSHAALHGTVWDADDPNAPVPPLGYGCRCKLEFRAKTDKIAAKTGLPKPIQNPPEAGNEALEGFWKDARQSDESQDEGGTVTPKDTFGGIIGKEIEEKNITPIDAFDNETGDVRKGFEVKNIADAKVDNRSQASVLSGFAVLERFAISASQRKKIVSQAKELLIEKPSLSESQALFDVVLRLRPSLVGSPVDKITRQRARRVARAILRSNGPLS